MKEYPCDLSSSGKCRYGGSKYFNYGFMRGNALYCRLEKMWIGDLKKCPLNVHPDKVDMITGGVPAVRGEV